MTSIFSILSWDRNEIRWEDHLHDLTPVEEHGGVLFKRDDYFAPLGYGGINGSKLRQLIWLFARDLRYLGVASGAVRESPQHAMVAAVAKHYGMLCAQFVGGDGGKLSHMVTMARELGAEILFTNPGYAATLNKKAGDYAREKGWLHIQTNITLDQDVGKFHEVGARQATNIPDHVETVVLPAGSCNSCVSVLLGIAKSRPPNLRRVILLGIGSNGSRDPGYVLRRLREAGGPDAEMLFAPTYHDDPQLEPELVPADAPYELHHWNLNGTGYCKYEQEMPFRWGGVDLHPRYEGKMARYFFQDRRETFEQYHNDRTLFWVVGSEPGVRLV